MASLVDLVEEGKEETLVDKYGDEVKAGLFGKVWEVHKFGGTSVANSDCLLKVAEIVEEQLGLSSTLLSSGNTVLEDDSKIKKNLAVVVSAMGGKPKVTDLLLDSVTAAAARDQDKVDSLLQKIMDKHSLCLDNLPLDEFHRNKLKENILKDTSDIRDILKTVSLMKWQASRILELISGYGETWSSQILTALLSERAKRRLQSYQTSASSFQETQYFRNHIFVYIDARRFITIDEDAIKDGAVCWDISLEKLKALYEEEVENVDDHGTIENVDTVINFVITGYIASNTDGVATTLQRDGSDYSAAITGYLLGSASISIWTDVDGVLSADPRKVPHAYVLPEVSFNEAMELAYFGAKVIHPKTMQPALMADPQIPIFIRNTFNSSFRGSRIYTSGTSHTDRDRCVCGFASIEKMALINVEGSGMIGVKGVARRMFGTLESTGVNVVLISQASSEHSITFATTMDQANEAKNAIEEEFHKEIKQNHIDEVAFQAPCSIIAAVGDGMHTTTGVSGKFFTALGDAKINILAISQGSSERNISAVVLESESTRALRAVHAAFRLSETTVRLGLVGMNEIGTSLVKLLKSEREKIKSAFEIDLQVCAILSEGSSTNIVVLKNQNDEKADSLTMASYDILTGGSSLLGCSAVSFQDGCKDDIAKTEPGDLSSFADFVNSEDCANVIILDCTDDSEVGNKHVEWLEAGINIVTANNSALSGSFETRNKIRSIEKDKKAKYMCEVTVGGGLPIISTLRDLLNSGDKIRHVDGILSVSMSYIMHRISPPPGLSQNQDFDEEITGGNFQGDLSMSPKHKILTACSFSEALKEAIALGLTEEDPASDFNNEYTARCLMVLASELGLDRGHTVEKIQAQSDKLIEIADIINPNSISDEINQKIAERVSKASSNGCVLRHISSVDVKTGGIDINILEVPENHVFATCPPSTECVRFFTQRYRQYPLIIQGPSAGEDSTASALLAEILHMMKSKVGPRSGVISRTGSSALLQ